jgi:hypothetical protein
MMFCARYTTAKKVHVLNQNVLGMLNVIPYEPDPKSSFNLNLPSTRMGTFKLFIECMSKRDVSSSAQATKLAAS